MRKYQILDIIDQKFKGKAFDSMGGQCFYLTGCGKECAIGMFIPDKHPVKTDFYSDSVKQVLKDFPDLKEVMPSKNLDFLMAFQKHHDDLPDDWNEDMQKRQLMTWVEREYDSYDHSKESRIA